MKRTLKKIILVLVASSLFSCKGIEFENQKIAKAEEFSRAEAMIFVAEEKNKYENKFGYSLWNLKSGDGSLYFKDYIVSITKGFIEKLMVLKLTAEDLNIIISNVDNEKIDNASKEYFNSLSQGDLDYIGCSEEDVKKLIERIRNKVSETKYYCAIGYSYSLKGDKDIDSMIKEADEMMYKDKMDYYSKPGNEKYRG